MDLSTRLVVVMHRFEERHTSNTGRLAALALTNSRVMVRGDPARPMDTAALHAGPGERLLLFPTRDAVTLDAALADALPRPVTLVVPDGSWPQARRAERREPSLAGIRRVCLAPGAPTTYRLRQGPRADGLATLEAVARALGVLEGAEVQSRLEALLATVVQRTLWSRGKLSTRDCHGAIPEAAVAEARASGRRRPPGEP